MIPLTQDVIPAVAGFLDPQSYVRLLSTCKITQMYLTPNRASAVYPHAIQRIKKMIEEMRVATKDPEFEYERTVGGVLVFAAPIGRGYRFKTYYHIRSNEWDATAAVTTVSIIVNRTVHTPRAGGGEDCTDLDSMSAKITPSFQHPMQAGKIEIKTITTNRFGKKIRTASSTVDYTDGFREILPELACDMYPLECKK